MKSPSPLGGEGGGEGAPTSRPEPPHPNPLPSGAREFACACRSILTAAVFLLFAYSTPAFADAAFQSWLQSLWPQAQALGVSRATFDTATRGLEPDLTLPDLVLPGRPEKPTAGQAEFVQVPADYVKETSIDPLAEIERRFGTPPAILLAIYGRETDYGRATDKRNAIRVLATQAYTGKRKEQF